MVDVWCEMQFPEQCSPFFKERELFHAHVLRVLIFIFIFGFFFFIIFYRYMGGDVFFPAHVLSVNLHGTYNVLYDDGDEESDLAPGRLRREMPS